ncbi:LOB domain-containing protein 30 [Striga hermonthica]|uniref:LOB domain-containing protein 30 n=1 Tax=Striga hermonthica TaxID=68872 RepID=A0A9N7RU09_STRHE|nr:LOB domain-containing protein 30 [Striga hermonthica]
MSTSNVASGSTAAGAAGGSGSGSSGPCGACKFLRRKCVVGCIFAPYFDSEQGAAHFAAVHKVFGASNVSKLLLHIPPARRLDAVVTICYEAQARLRDPIYGCVAHIFALHQQVVNLQAELNYLQAHLASLEIPNPPPAPPQPLFTPPQIQSVSDLPVVPAAYDLSSFFDNPSLALYQRQLPNVSPAGRVPPELPSSTASGGGGDLQELARELLSRHAPPVMPCRDHQVSALPPHSR